ncbi:MAG: hypothetical protein DSM106950_39950 [Stigonema ocellatum SAG 48.90 = DSM 106950]|nr:hypothetical protein [Stigonema ocellatum SAG 48.90 = DSM 106950]
MGSDRRTAPVARVQFHYQQDQNVGQVRRGNGCGESSRLVCSNVRAF